MTQFTQGDPTLIAKAIDDSILFYGMDGRGATAPGAVVLRKMSSPYHPYATHFANTQCGGYHNGNYFETEEEARHDFKTRCERYDRDGDLHQSFQRSMAK